MSFKNGTSFAVRLVLTLILLGGMSEVRSAEALPLGTDNLTAPAPAPVVGCNTISDQFAGMPNPIKIAGRTMYLDIVNPNAYSVAIDQLYMMWNWTAGRLAGDGHLWLQRIDLNGNTFWTGNINAPSFVVPLSASIMLPGGGPSRITFTFNATYARPQGEELQIGFSTPGCELYPIHVINQ